jgi:hypothetical protein
VALAVRLDAVGDFDAWGPRVLLVARNPDANIRILFGRAAEPCGDHLTPVGLDDGRRMTGWIRCSFVDEFLHDDGSCLRFGIGRDNGSHEQGRERGDPNGKQDNGFHQTGWGWPRWNKIIRKMRGEVEVEV